MMTRVEAKRLVVQLMDYGWVTTCGACHASLPPVYDGVYVGCYLCGNTHEFEEDYCPTLKRFPDLWCIAELCML